MNISTVRKHTVSPYLYMQFAEPLGTADSSVDAGWDFLADRWQPCLIEQARRLAPTMVRFGGCFASYYHWREGVGPRELRPPMRNLCWDGVYLNQVGTAEIADFCAQVNAEPLFVVNMESDGRMNWAYPRAGENRLGTAREAAEWVAYCNDPDNAERKSHGRAEPYNVRWWQIGNETSYDRQGYTLAQTADATVRFGRAMKEVDPNIMLLGWADSGWARDIAAAAGEYVTHLAFHHHMGAGGKESPLQGTAYRDDPDRTWEYLMNAYKSLDECLARHREEALSAGKRLAMTEGHFALNGRNRCEVLSSWGAGVAYARCLLTQERYADVLDIATMADFFGNRWQVNAIMLPTPARQGAAYLMPVGEVMRLYRHHVGQYAVELRDVPAGVDACGSISADGRTLYLHLANTDRAHATQVPLTVENAKISTVTAYEIAADSTTEITPLCPHVFEPTEKKITDGVYTLPPAGVAAIELAMSNEQLGRKGYVCAQTEKMSNEK